ncbi:hypothetical protein HH310_28810 [Actinoplanes sp. TBRC 11911]|uniref:hypothetical protein n=1 Tax=Actinoplanes sp. TBRC 11911 TaxID=2729386 RepID=UPI00145D15A1|nr:hypothetical protein [Actinoplanes sp. TBRC 11911]NMO55173.1 hypothetical protein [Actinoplanes sp. TBRC 11911]
MDAIDSTLLRLADPAARAGLLTDDALLQIATVAYEIDPATVTGPTTAAYDRVDLAVPIARGGTATARLTRAGDALPWDVTLTWDDPSGSAAGADAVLAARLAVRAARAGGTIEVAEVASSGRDGGRDRLGLRLTMSAPPDPATATPLVLPVVVAVLVAAADTAPRELLRATHSARRAALAYPLPEPPPDAPPRRADRVVCWLLPAAAFEQEGWPGADAGARLAAARGWLAAGGIAVVTT